MTSHFTGTTKTEDGVTESSVWTDVSSDDCEKQATLPYYTGLQYTTLYHTTRHCQ